MAVGSTYSTQEVSQILTNTQNIETDTQSIETKIDAIEQHFHSATKVYPTLAAGVEVTASAVAWTLGNYAEIVPASTITGEFDITGVAFEGASDGDEVYELVIYEGTTERFRVRKAFAGGFYGNEMIVHPVSFAANAQVQAKVASSPTASGVLTISIMYHLN